MNLAGWGPAGQSTALANFAIDIEDFEGPLDLLLHLIEKQGLDITGVSILSVTDQFVAYAHEIRERFAEAASEFLLVASQLALLKSRALLPHAESTDDEEESAEDLAERLRVYAAFKDVAYQLDNRLRAGSGSFIRVAPPTIKPPTAKAGSGDLGLLLQAMDELLRDDPPSDTIPSAPVRRFHVGDKINELTKLLKENDGISFDQISSTCADRSELIATFLAVLHLVHGQVATVKQQDVFGPIVLRQANPHALNQ